MFQSFFYWKSASKLSDFANMAASNASFNPSSIGNRPQSYLHFVEQGTSKRFQSFFYWKSASKTRVVRLRLERLDVSILLLLEIGLKDLASFSRHQWKLRRFNLSFIGNWSKSDFFCCGRCYCLSFNHSSIGNRPQRPCLLFAAPMETTEFQSFFYWKSASK